MKKFVIALIFICTYCTLQAQSNLRCEYIIDPIGIDIAKPALSWNLTDKRRSAMQTAYRIVVASSPELLSKNSGDIWDTGEIKSDECLQIIYDGKPLKSRQQCFWKVFVNSNAADGIIKAQWSAPAKWEMGFIEQTDWQGYWIESPACKPVSNSEVNIWMRNSLIPLEKNNAKDFADPELRERAKKAQQNHLERILPAPIFRRQIKIDADIVKARMYISGLGFSEAYINDKAASDRMHDPSVTLYKQRGGYVVHDITPLMQRGDNTISVIIGSGWMHEVTMWGSPTNHSGNISLRAQIEIETADGKKIIVPTDRQWQTAVGPILKSDYFIGEIYDARRCPDWKIDKSNRLEWREVQESAPAVPMLQFQMCEPERVLRKVKPVAITEPYKGIYLFDLGEIIVGTVELNTIAPQGTNIVIRTGEGVYNPSKQGSDYTGSIIHYDQFENDKLRDGMLLSKPRGGGYFGYGFRIPGYNPRGPLHIGLPTMLYVANGDKNGEVYRPSFTTNAIRYIEIQGLTSKPTPQTITGLVLSNDQEQVGEFKTDYQPFNDIFEACINSTRYNTHGMTWDNCVERLQSQVYHAWSAPFFSQIFTQQNLWRKTLEDMRLISKNQDMYQSIPIFTGTIYGNRNVGVRNPVTQGVMVELPWELYERYADKREIEAHYPHMKIWVESYFPNKDGIIIEKASMAAWTDHFCVEAAEDCEWSAEWDQMCFMSMMMYQKINQTADFAKILGKSDDEKSLRELSDKIEKVIYEKWYNPQYKSFGAARNKRTKEIDASTGWHGMMAMAITAGIVPEAQIPAMIELCIQDMKKHYNNHHAAGHITHQLLYDIFSDYGYIETCYTMMNSTGFPSMRWMISTGNKTIPEGPASPRYIPGRTSACQNECQEPARWFIKHVCGVSPDYHNPGFKHIILRPFFPAQLGEASLNTITPYGKLNSSWIQKDGKITWNVTIPPNTYATVRIPSGVDKILENGEKATISVGCSVEKQTFDESVFRLGSGQYTFEFPSPRNKPSMLSLK